MLKLPRLIKKKNFISKKKDFAIFSGKKISINVRVSIYIFSIRMCGQVDDWVLIGLGRIFVGCINGITLNEYIFNQRVRGHFNVYYTKPQY